MVICCLAGFCVLRLFNDVNDLITAIIICAGMLLLAAIYGLIVYWVYRRRWSCPRCKEKALQLQQWRNLRRPESTGFFKCHACQGRFKKRHGNLTPASDAEWANGGLL